MKRRLYRVLVNGEIKTELMISLDSKQSHYLLHVLRKKKLDEVCVFNQSSEWIARIECTKHSICKVLPLNQVKSIVENINENINQTTDPQITDPYISKENSYHKKKINLIICPIKRMQFLIEKSTEIGVNNIYFIRSKNTVISEISYHKINSWIQGAIQQSDQNIIPNIAIDNQNNDKNNDVIVMRTIKNFLEEFTKNNYLIVLDRDSDNIVNVVRNIKNHHNTHNIQENTQQNIQEIQEISLIVGPEGGFSLEEKDFMLQLPNTYFANINQNNLRAETAVIASIAIVRCLLELSEI
jgi:16S rRNA (uracil1498-N3)-methyltransferase